MLANLYAKACHFSPRFNKASKRRIYQFLASHYPHGNWTFMNYGYAPLDESEGPPMLLAGDEDNRFCIQLYHMVASAIPMAGLRVLEVGSGRGGGSAYIRNYLNPRLMVGVDFSKNSVHFSNQAFTRMGAIFLPGDAEHLPFKDGSFDAVVNVESSHCYGAMDGFLREVHRVLRRGGHFLFTDFRDRDKLPMLDAQLATSGMTLIKHRDITTNVVAALDRDHLRKVSQIRRGASKRMASLFRQFAGSPNSRIYRRFRDGNTVYQSFVLRKTH